MFFDLDKVIPMKHVQVMKHNQVMMMRERRRSVKRATDILLTCRSLIRALS